MTTELTKNMERLFLQMQILTPAIRLAYLNNEGIPLMQSLCGLSQQFNELGMATFKQMSNAPELEKETWGKILSSIEQHIYKMVIDIKKIAGQVELRFAPKERPQ